MLCSMVVDDHLKTDINTFLQANLEAASLQLKDEDYEELSQLKHQQRSVPAKGFLKEGGPYKVRLIAVAEFIDLGTCSYIWNDR